MGMTNRWPESLHRYEVDGGSALLLRPNGLIPGQLFAFAASGSIVLLAAFGLLFSTERGGAAIALAIGVIILCFPLSQTLRWIRIERATEGWLVTQGMLGWRTHSRALTDAEIATAMVVKDERGYRNESRPGEHVRVAFASKPFNDAPASFELAETFRIPAPDLAALRDMLAGERALK